MSEAEVKKKDDMRQLRSCRQQILKATKVAETRKAAADVESLLHEMKKRSNGEQKELIDAALNEIEMLWKYDTTRGRVCMRLQSLISHLLQHLQR